MRLDKYLKLSRVVKRRTIANEMCDKEKVFVNEKPQRASYEVKIGDKIEIKFGDKVISHEITEIPKDAKKK